MYQKYIKSPLDKTLAFFILILTLPITGVIAILIKLESGSPILFIQDRTGKDGVNFKMLKFRSMPKANDVRDQATENYHTKIGKIIRKLSIDELPQLINILGN
jgi:lipopolysaccharide/colanic/teichoic acid biosynthesis glycosyltransferase